MFGNFDDFPTNYVSVVGYTTTDVYNDLQYQAIKKGYGNGDKAIARVAWESKNGESASYYKLVPMHPGYKRADVAAKDSYYQIAYSLAWMWFKKGTNYTAEQIFDFSHAKKYMNDKNDEFKCVYGKNTLFYIAKSTPTLTMTYEGIVVKNIYSNATDMLYGIEDRKSFFDRPETHKEELHPTPYTIYVYGRMYGSGGYEKAHNGMWLYFSDWDAFTNYVDLIRSIPPASAWDR